MPRSGRIGKKLSVADKRSSGYLSAKLPELSFGCCPRSSHRRRNRGGLNGWLTKGEDLPYACHILNFIDSCRICPIKRRQFARRPGAALCQNFTFGDLFDAVTVLYNGVPEKRPLDIGHLRIDSGLKSRPMRSHRGRSRLKKAEQGLSLEAVTEPPETHLLNLFQLNRILCGMSALLKLYK